MKHGWQPAISVVVIATPPSSHPHDRAFSLQCTLFPSLAARLWVATIGDETKDRAQFPKPEKTVKSLNTHRHSSPFIPSSPPQIYLALSGCIFLQTLYVHTRLFRHVLPVHTHTIQPDHTTTPCWHGTQNIMYIHNCWWLLCAPMHGGRLRVQSKDIKAHSNGISTSVSSFSLLCLLLVRAL